MHRRTFARDIAVEQVHRIEQRAARGWLDGVEVAVGFEESSGRARPSTSKPRSGPRRGVPSYMFSFAQTATWSPTAAGTAAATLAGESGAVDQGPP